MKTDLFQSCGHCWVLHICWHIECSTFTASSFRIWNSSTGIPTPPLAFFIVMLPEARLTSHSRMPGSRWVITPLWLPALWRPLLYSSSVYSCHLFLISSASVSFVQFSSIHSLSRVRLFVTPWIAACQASLFINQLPEYTRTHVHRVGDAIQPSHLLLSPSPPVPNPSQHQSLCQWVNSLHEVAKVLEFQL